MIKECTTIFLASRVRLCFILPMFLMWKSHCLTMVLISFYMVIHPSLKVQTGQNQICLWFWCGKHTCKNYNMKQVTLEELSHSPWAGWKVQKGHTKVNIEYGWEVDVEYIRAQLKHDTSNLWSIITLTRCYWMPPTAHQGNDNTPPA